MARQESIACGGFFKTPTSQLPLIAGLLSTPDLPEVDEETPSYGRNAPPKVAVMDPCAGEGEAITEIVKLITGGEVDFYTCEMERTRHATLKATIREAGQFSDEKRTICGDAFRIMFDARSNEDGVGLLFANPPYEPDRAFARLEEKFLQRFAPALASGGVLVFLVPHYALAASAKTIAQSFTDVRCYKFVGAEFAIYKQVVLFAKRREADLLSPDPDLLAKVNAWSASADGIEDLPAPGTAGFTYELPTVEHYRDALSEWSLRSIDMTAILGKYQPWHETTRARGLVPAARILPDMPLADVMHRTYEVATPPRPAHIAAGLAAGIFNGQRITPDDDLSKLPPLLVKGVFDREWRTVEEKHNKNGEKTSEVQVQQPKLVITVLDLKKHEYHTLASGTDLSKSASTVADFGVADLLKHYGKSLAGVMESQCEILYDPRYDAGKVTVAESARPLFAAQAHTVRACIEQLKKPGNSVLLLGEVGVGKSAVSLLTAKTYGAKRVLVMAPPHLVTKSWPDEVAVSTPEAEYRLLQTVADVEALLKIPADKTVVAVVSREVAKLGHSWEAVSDGVCPKCGMEVPAGVDLAKKHARCEGGAASPNNDYARLAYQLALHLRAMMPNDPDVRDVLRGRIDKKRRKSVEGEIIPYSVPQDFILALRSKIASDYVAQDCHVSDAFKKMVLYAFTAFPDAPAANTLVKFASIAWYEHDWQNFVDKLLALIPPGGALGAAFEVASRWPEHYSQGRNVSGSAMFQEALKLLAGTPGVEDDASVSPSLYLAGVNVRREDGKLTLDDVEAGTPAAGVKLLACLKAHGRWKAAPVCGEPLYGAIPEPRRFPLAKYIVKRHKKLFDFFIQDEGHEVSNDGSSAQGRAFGRLSTLGLPTIFMTGSLLNGYASSVYHAMECLSPDFREEFDRGDESAFVDRYGYRKRVIQDREDGEVVAFGSQSDRVERSERDVGEAPGILPVFLFRHLLPKAVTLHKDDLRLDLPELTHSHHAVVPSDEVLAEFDRIKKALVDQIKEDRFSEEGLAGKLFGALSGLPGYLDMCTEDVSPGGYEIRYPESVGGGLVAAGKSFPKTMILPKEKLMLNTIEAELAEGRRVMVFGWHLGLLPRLQRLIEERIGETAPILYADKVPASKRQAWIEKEIVGKKRRVMLANPVAISTGLNVLTYFATEWFHENPAVNPITFRQAVGRIDRIGQTKPTRVIVPYYGDTLQENMYDLLMSKVSVSTAVDGLSNEGVMIAAGLGDPDYLVGLSIGKQLWAMMGEGKGEDRASSKRPELRVVAGGKRR